MARYVIGPLAFLITPKAMLISFNSSIQELENETTESIGQLFSELLRASDRGDHLIVINRQSCQWALDFLGLNPREKSRLRWLQSNYTQYGGYIKNFPVSLSINVGDENLEELGKHHYVIGHKKLLQSDFLSPAMLLLEHEVHDGKLYAHILREITKLQPIKSICYSVEHGGGSHIVQRLQTELDRSKVVVCAIDSDKYSPCDDESGTARNLQKVSTRNNHVGTLVQTIGREIENVIPLEIIKDFGLCPEYSDFDKLEHLLEKQTLDNPTDCLWLYFDLKNGLIGSRVLSKNKKKSTRNWLESKFTQQGEDFIDVHILGFGENLLSQFMNSEIAKSEFHRVVRDPSWQSQFSAFFEEIYWYLIAERPKAII